MEDARTSEELLSHLAFVRRVARALVRDESNADDLAQETFVTALRSPPRAGSPLRAWLAGVARKLAWRARRGEERRLVRERGAPAGEATASAAETAAILELTRLVVAELHQLGEPYATTLRRRFFDGLDASEIAARDGIPVETVRTHLKRGLAQLRERLDARHGGRREAWAALLIGGAAMSAKSKLLVAAAVIAAAGGGWWIVETGDGSRPPPMAPVAGGPPAVALASDPNSPAADEPARESVTAAIDTSLGPSGILLHGGITDPRGAPIGGGWITMEPERPGVAPVQISADESGCFAFGGLDAGVWRLGASGVEGFEAQTQRVRVSATPAVQRIDLVLSPSILVPVRIVTPDGRRLLDSFEGDEAWRMPRGLSLQTSIGASKRLLPADTVSSSRSRGLVYGRKKEPRIGSAPKRLELADDVDGLLAVPALPIHVGVYFKHVLLDDVLVESEESGARLVVAPEELEDCLATVTVRFVDAATKRPLLRGRVSLEDRQTSGLGQEPDAAGVVRFERMSPGLLHFARRADDHEPFETFVEIEPGAELDLGEIALTEKVDAAVQVVDEQGRPRRANVQGFALDRLAPELPFDSEFHFGADDDGRVAHLWIGRGRWLLFAGARDGERFLSSDAVVLDATNGAPAPTEIVVHPTTRGRIEIAGRRKSSVSLRVVDVAGLPVHGWQLPLPISWSDMLPRGTYEFRARGDDGREASSSVVVGAEPFVVKLSLEETPAAEQPIVDAQPSGEVVTAGATIAHSAPARSGILLHGALRDRDGQPVKAKEMSATDSKGRRHRGGSVAEGGYAVPGLSAGTCELTIVADGFEDWNEPVELGSGNGPVRHDVVLEKVLRIPVRFLTPDGQPLSNALRDRAKARPWVIGAPPLSIVATREPLSEGKPGWSTRRATEWGRFVLGGSSFDGTLDGTLELRGALPLVANVVLERRLIESRTIAGPVDGLEFRIDPATILGGLSTLRFRVADAASGAPLDLEEVGIGGPFGEASPAAKPFRQRDGSYELAGLDPGEMSLFFSAAGHEVTRSKLLLAPGELRDLDTILLAPSGSITGRILGPDGKHVRAQLSVIVADRVLPPPFFGRERYLSMGEVDGDFSLSVGRRRVVVGVTAEGFAWESQLVDATAGEVRDLTFDLVAGTQVSLRVAAERWRWLLLELFDEHDQYVGGRGLVGGETIRFALRPGKYRAVIVEDGIDRASREFEVADAPFEIEIPLR